MPSVLPDSMHRHGDDRREEAADQRGQGLGVAMNDYVQSDHPSRLQAVTALEQWLLTC